MSYSYHLGLDFIIIDIHNTYITYLGNYLIVLNELISIHSKIKGLTNLDPYVTSGQVRKGVHCIIVFSHRNWKILRKMLISNFQFSLRRVGLSGVSPTTGSSLGHRSYYFHNSSSSVIYFKWHYVGLFVLWLLERKRNGPYERKYGTWNRYFGNCVTSYKHFHKTAYAFAWLLFRKGLLAVW